MPSPLGLGAADRAYLEGIVHSARAAEAASARHALAEALDLRFEGKDLQWALKRREYGAPTLELLGPSDALESVSAPFVSLAHTEHMAVAALSDVPCGVDVESLSRSGVQRAWKRVARPQEQDWALQLPPSQRLPYAVLAWTIKEAWAKLTGDGLMRTALDIAIEAQPKGQWLIHSPRAIAVYTTVSEGQRVSVVTHDDGNARTISGTSTDWASLPVQIKGLGT